MKHYKKIWDVAEKKAKKSLKVSEFGKILLASIIGSAATLILAEPDFPNYYEF